MKKKIILLAICLFSVFAFFTACNGDKKQTQTGPAKEISAAENSIIAAR